MLFKQLKDQLERCQTIQLDTQIIAEFLREEVTKECERSFEKLDKNQSGKVSVWEYLSHYLQNVDPQLTQEALQDKANEIMALFEFSDQNGDLLLDRDEMSEFQQLLNDLDI